MFVVFLKHRLVNTTCEATAEYHATTTGCWINRWFFISSTPQQSQLNRNAFEKEGGDTDDCRLYRGLLSPIHQCTTPTHLLPQLFLVWLAPTTLKNYTTTHHQHHHLAATTLQSSPHNHCCIVHHSDKLANGKSLFCFSTFSFYCLQVWFLGCNSRFLYTEPLSTGKPV